MCDATGSECDEEETKEANYGFAAHADIVGALGEHRQRCSVVQGKTSVGVCEQLDVVLGLHIDWITMIAAQLNLTSTLQVDSGWSR